MTNTSFNLFNVKSISTHTLTWSVTSLFPPRWRSWRFQLTRSRGAWLKNARFGGYHRHFNSHAHVERDKLKTTSPRRTGISTHTLTWSVTPELNNKIVNYCISTHTLTWSVTGFLLPLFLMVLISTHTLTWSVTGTKCTIIINERFQLTRSRGAWLYRRGCRPVCRNFNSHAHVERDNQLRLHNKNI